MPSQQSLEEEQEAECARLTQTIKELETEVKRLRTVVATAADSLPGGQARMLLYYENVKHATKKSRDSAASPRSVTVSTAQGHANASTAAQSGPTAARSTQHRKAPERKKQGGARGSVMVRPAPSISWRGHQEEARPSREIGFVHAAYRHTGGIADEA